MHRVRQPQLKSQLVFNPSIDVTISVSGASVPFQSRFRAVSEPFQSCFVTIRGQLSRHLDSVFHLFCFVVWSGNGALISL